MIQKPLDIGLPMERRRCRRPFSGLAGLLVYGPCDTALDCDIVDLDAAGARIRLPLPPRIMPTDVRLLLPGSAIAYEATLAWRRGATIGLAFDRRHDLTVECQPAVATLRAFCLTSAFS
jgi:hypothetical protein